MNNKIKFNTGYDLEFRPISQAVISKINLRVQREFEAKDEPLEVPTYYTIEPSKELPDGKKEPHNETTLMTDDDKDNWATHKNALERLGNKQWEEVAKYVLLRGIKTDTIPTTKWIDNEKEFGIKLPENEQDLEIEYILNELLASPLNIGMAVSKVIALGLEGFVPDLEVEATEDSFQSDVDAGETETTESERVDEAR